MNIPFQLPDYYTDLHKKSFIVRSLYEYIISISCIALVCFIAFMFSLFSLLLYWCVYDVRFVAS